MLPEALDTLNQTLKKGLVTSHQAELEIKNVIIPQLKKSLGIQDQAQIKSLINDQNYKIYTKFWEEEYLGRDLVAPGVSQGEFLKALSYIEPLSIMTSDRKEIQRKLDATLSGSRHKRYGGRINQLLGYLNRGFVLYLKKAEIPTVHYIDWTELQSIVSHIQNPDIQALAVVLFCTGARLGEAFTFKPRDLKADGSIFINQQMDRHLRIREIKNRKPHKTLLLPEGQEAFQKWAAITNKQDLRKRTQHPIIDAAKKTFNDKERQISPHDLRHSYAIHMLGLGVPIDRVAKLLGDSVKTTEDYYAGFVMSSNEIDFVKRIIEKSKA